MLNDKNLCDKTNIVKCVLGLPWWSMLPMQGTQVQFPVRELDTVHFTERSCMSQLKILHATTKTEDTKWPQLKPGTAKVVSTFWKDKFGLPLWLSGKESTCQCRRHRFDPWSGKIPRATEQLSLCRLYCACALELESRNYWAHVPLLKPMCPRAHASQQVRPLQGKPRALQLGSSPPTGSN